MDELSSHLLKTFEFFKRLGNTKNYLNGDITSWMRNMGIVSFNPQIENEEKVPITEGKNEIKEEKESDASEIDEKSKDLTQISDEEQIIHVKNN